VWKIDPSQFRLCEEELRRQWIKRLYLEYDYFCQEYRLRMRQPLIRVESLQSKWGTWDPSIRTITINSELIKRHPWDTVLEILKHEMAHQMVSEMRYTSRPHGLDFLEACRILRVAKWATGASGAISDEEPGWNDRVLGAEDEKLLRRVEKLLSLANSSNEHEALLAMQRVQEIYARHNLGRLRTHQEAALVTLTINLRKKRIDRLVSTICLILGEHFFVRVIFGHIYDAKDLCDYRSVELIGTRANVLMAEYVYQFLREKLDFLWDRYRQRSGVDGRARQDYMLGLLTGFRKKLTDGTDEVMGSAAGELAPEETKALVALGSREVDEFVRYRYPRLGRRRWSTGYSDQESYAAGVEEGGRIVLNKPLEDRATNRGLMLPGGS